MMAAAARESLRARPVHAPADARRAEGPYPPGRLVAVASAPRVYVVDGFASDAECAAVCAIGDAVDELAAVGLDVSRGVAGVAADLPPLDATLTRLAARVEALVGFRDALDESVRFRRYQPGEWHPEHTDAVCPQGALHLVVTALVCVDAPIAGGETVFPRAPGGPLAVPHRRGRLVAWFNHTPDGAVDAAALHAGAVVRAGSKATLGKFLHGPLTRASRAPATHERAGALDRLVASPRGDDEPREAARLVIACRQW